MYHSLNGIRELEIKELLFKHEAKRRSPSKIVHSDRRYVSVDQNSIRPVCNHNWDTKRFSLAQIRKTLWHDDVCVLKVRGVTSRAVASDLRSTQGWTEA